MTTNPLNRLIETEKGKIQDIIQKMDLSRFWKYKLMVTNPQISTIYGLPKTHKEGNKMCPITPNTDTVYLFAERIETSTTTHWFQKSKSQKHCAPGR
jgi:hypothetical protein